MDDIVDDSPSNALSRSFIRGRQSQLDLVPLATAG
jgi:hypothetical protein